MNQLRPLVVGVHQANRGGWIAGLPKVGIEAPYAVAAFTDIVHRRNPYNSSLATVAAQADHIVLQDELVAKHTTTTKIAIASAFQNEHFPNLMVSHGDNEIKSIEYDDLLCAVYPGYSAKEALVALANFSMSLGLLNLTRMEAAK